MDDAGDPIAVGVPDPFETCAYAVIGCEVDAHALGFRWRMRVAALSIETDHPEAARQTADHGPAYETGAARHKDHAGRVASFHWHLSPPSGAFSSPLSVMMPPLRPRGCQHYFAGSCGVGVPRP